MAMASGNYGAWLGTLLVLSACSTGCGLNMQNIRNSGSAADEARELGEEATESAAIPPAPAGRTVSGKPGGASAGGQRLSVAARPVPLPRQAYDDNGKRIPYAAQPNPYTTGAVPPVSAEAKALFAVADAQLQEGALDRAQDKFAALTEKFPELSGPWVKLGVIAERREQYNLAISHYAEAINRNRDNVNAYIALGMVQRRLGLFNDARDTYLAALDVWKDFPEAHLNLAILYDLYADEAEAAQKHYEAYDFLTGGSNQNVRKWLVDVRNRTGITTSFIDTPPVVVEPIKVDGAGKGSVATTR